MKALLAVLMFAAAAVQAAETTPTKFITQTLEPTGGKIERPKDWHYLEQHHGPVYVWTISREKISRDKGYDTGVRIQTVVGVKERTGKTPKQFILEFVEKKKKTPGVKVIETCRPKDQGLFTRICLQVEEGPHRILYSLFWGNVADIAVLSIAGTKKEHWLTYAPAFDRMSHFELIDMKRFEKN